MSHNNKEYVYIKDLSDTLDIYALALEQIFIDIEFIEIINGRNILINEGLEYGIEYLGYTNFKPSILKHQLVKEALNKHFKALKERPEREKEERDRYVKQLQEKGYTIEDNDSMDIIAIKDGETLKMIFQESDEKIVTTSFSWKEERGNG